MKQDTIHSNIESLLLDDTVHVERELPKAKATWVYMPPMTEAPGTVYTHPLLQNSWSKTAIPEQDYFYSSSGEPRQVIYCKPLLRNEFVDSLYAKIPIVDYRPNGIPGDPLPYRFRNDNFVNIALLLSFFLMIWVLAHSKHHISQSFKNLFFPHKGNNKDNTTKTDSEWRGQLFLIFQTCFTLGVLVFDYVQMTLPSVFDGVSPYMILSITTGGFAVYYLTKLLLYTIVNSVFFDKQSVQEWNSIYLLAILLLGVGLFPLALLVVYFDLNFITSCYIFLAVLILSKLLIIYKSFNIFSGLRFNFIHIFLYLCTLEILPPLVLWRSLIYILNILIAID